MKKIVRRSWGETPMPAAVVSGVVAGSIFACAGSLLTCSSSYAVSTLMRGSTNGSVGAGCLVAAPSVSSFGAVSRSNSSITLAWSKSWTTVRRLRLVGSHFHPRPLLGARYHR